MNFCQNRNKILSILFKKDVLKKMSEKWLIVGLGNPGDEYSETRHNAGFILLDEIAKTSLCGAVKQKFDGLLAEAVIAEKQCLFLKPLTYMNNSGFCVYSVAKYYQIPLENIIVLHDDTNFKIGQIRIRQHGSGGGHKGIGNIIQLFGSDKVVRIKIGVNDKPNKSVDLKDWVLGRFSKDELINLKSCAPFVKEAIVEIINNNIENAMNKFNGTELI